MPVDSFLWKIIALNRSFFVVLQPLDTARWEKVGEKTIISAQWEKVGKPLHQRARDAVSN